MVSSSSSIRQRRHSRASSSPPPAGNSSIIRNAIEGNLSAPAPSMPPCPFEQRSNNDTPPLISDSGSDSDTYYTPRLKTTITDASSFLLRPPLTPPTAPTLSSSQSLPQPLLRNLHPTPSDAAHSTPPGSHLHPPHLCLATSEITHLPPSSSPTSSRSAYHRLSLQPALSSSRQVVTPS
jgi:hypothetical protein